MNKNLFKDPLSRNIGYLSALVFVGSLQVLILLVFVYQFIPMAMDPITQGVPPTLLKLFQPNRNQFFYHAFIAAAILGQAGILYVYRARLSMPELAGEIREFLIAETLWVSWQLFAVFKILQYDNPAWARSLLYAGFAAALLAKIFWPELKRAFKLFPLWLGGEIPVLWRSLADGGVILVLLLVIMIPDPDRALLRMALADSFNHFDQWLMAPLWAYHKGLTPMAQFFDPLNGGVLVLVHAVVNFMGGVTYGHVVQILCLLAVLYYLAFYYFLRFWLGILPAIFGVLLAVKLQMFHMGMNPLGWAYPAQSVLRHTFDVAVFFCLLLFARYERELFLWLAALFIGISLSYVFDTGTYMLGAFYAYVAVLLLIKETRCLLCPNLGQWRKILGLALLPWLVMIIAWVIYFGPVVFHREFWGHWPNGEDAVSILSCLRDRNFFAFFAAFVPPIIYALGAATVTTLVFWQRWSREKLFIIPLSVYGLGVYAHFLWHSTINYYYMVPLPLVACICFWGTQCLNGFSNFRRRLIKLIFAVLVAIGLFTNFLFTYYPNVFNMAGENGDQQKAYYKANFNFNNDSEFIRHWTLPNQRVALISGFETQMLLQADRSSFFYKSLTMMDQADIQSLVEQLEASQWELVFINKRILNSVGLERLIAYLGAHYHYNGQQSDDLILLKRKHE